VWYCLFSSGDFVAKKLIDGVFTIKQSQGDFHYLEYGYTNGIQGNATMFPNLELIREVETKGYTIPDNYYCVQFEREMLDNDFAKFRVPYPYYPNRQKMKLVEDAMQRILLPYMFSEALSFDEATSLMDLSSSPGWPLNQKYQTKREALNMEYDLIKQIVLHVVETGEIDYVWCGRRYRCCYWLTSPKEEIRSLEKLANDDKTKNKIRTFMCGDIISYVVALMLYAKQNDNLLAMASTDHWSAVGCSQWYGGWDVLTRILLRMGVNRFRCLDAKHMEASFCDAIQEIVYKCRNGGVHGMPLAKRWYLSNIVYSMLIDVHGNLVMKTGKNPSGGFNTLTDNGLAMMSVFLYDLSFSCSTVGELVEAYRLLSVKIMGDDSIFVDDTRFLDIIEHASEIGFNLVREASGPIEDCTFLSNGFVFDKTKGCYIFKPNFDKLMSGILFWFKKSSWRLCFVKLCSVRKLVYAFSEWRQEVDYLIQYCLSRHNEDMIREDRIDDLLSYDSVIANLMSNHENEMLIYGPYV